MSEHYPNNRKRKLDINDFEIGYNEEVKSKFAEEMRKQTEDIQVNKLKDLTKDCSKIYDLTDRMYSRIKSIERFCDSATEDNTSIKDKLSKLHNETKDFQKQVSEDNNKYQNMLISLNNKVVDSSNENKENCLTVQKQVSEDNEDFRNTIITLFNKVIDLSNENCLTLQKENLNMKEFMKEESKQMKEKISELKKELTILRKEIKDNCEIHQEQNFNMKELMKEESKQMKEEVISQLKNGFTILRNENKDNNEIHQKQIYCLEEICKMNDKIPLLSIEKNENWEKHQQQICNLTEAVKENNRKNKDEFSLKNEILKIFEDHAKINKATMNEFKNKQKEISKKLNILTNIKSDLTALSESFKKDNNKFYDSADSLNNGFTTLHNEIKENWAMYIVGYELEKKRNQNNKEIFQNILDQCLRSNTEINEKEKNKKKKTRVNEETNQNIPENMNAPSTSNSNRSIVKRKKKQPLINLNHFFNAIKKNNLTLVEDFLKAKPDLINITHDKMPFYTPLLTACNCDNNEMVLLLLRYGANIFREDRCFHSPLGFAAKDGYLNVVKTLITFGSDVNIRDKQGNTALHTASYNGHLEVIEYLIEAGVNTTLKNEKGYTALDLAQKQNKNDIVCLLKEL